MSTSQASHLAWYRSLPVHTVDIHGSPMAYRKVGTGPTVLFVHGWPLSGVTFREMTKRLSQRYTCVILDLPGAGNSQSRASAPEFFDSIGDAIDGFVDAVGLKDYAIVAHDSGAAGARLHAARRPGAVRAMVFGNTETPGHQSRLVRALRLLAFLPGAASVFRFLLQRRRFLVSNAGFGGSFFDTRFIEGEFHDAIVTVLKARVNDAMDQLRRADLNAVDDKMRRAHASITAPVLLIWGKQDRFFPLEGAHRLVKELAHVRLEVVDRAKLFVHEEHAQDFTALAEPFLAEAFA